MKIRRILFPTLIVLVILAQLVNINLPAAQASTSCDAAQFVADVTVPDGTSFAPGTPISKTWRLKNIGTCTWTTSYAIVFYSGAKMGAPSAVNLPTSVAPGSTVDVTVNMTAPTTAGHYRGHWMLRNAANVLFGVGPNGTYTFFIDILVSTTSTTTTAYDFVANYCSATWTSGAGGLPCPGADGDARGFVQKLDAPKLEDGSTGAPGLLTFPQNVTDGIIQGIYPAFAVQAGDRFQSIVDCQYGATGCYITFRLDYQIGSGPILTLKSFREKIDGLYYRFNIDLNSVAGQNVKFILTILASGSPTADRAVWSGAKIVRAGGVVITPPPSACDKATLVADVTIPDGTVMSGGTPFTKTWRLQNVSTCTWTTAYKLVFFGGDYMGASATAFNLPSSVAPGGTIDLSVNLAAPITPGNFIGNWKLRNASGADFGVGLYGTSAFTVNINVLSVYDSVFDFVTSACSATWSSGAGILPCPGPDGDGRGYVLKLGNHQMEDGTYSNEGLVTFPQYVTDGYIKGVYPPFSVQNGDHFQAYVGCQKGGPANCYITFRLDYQIGSGPVYTLKSARERLEDMVYRMDVDLSSLAGQDVKLILMVQAYGSPDGDRAVWSAPRIVRSGSSGTVVPTVTGPTPTVPPPSTPTVSGPVADLSVTVNDGVTFYTPGSALTYSILVTNNGPQNVTGATFAVVKPTGVTSWVVTCSPDSGATCTAGPITLATNINDTVNIPAGKKLTYSVVASVSSSAVGNLITTGSITNPAAMPDPNLTNNSATDTDSPPSADLAISKTDGISIYNPGGSTTYTIVVMNNGPLNMTNAIFTDHKPAQITLWTWSCAPDAGASCNTGPLSVSSSFSDVVSIPAGKKVTYSVAASISPAATGNLVNTATITSPVGNPDPLPANNTATDTDSGPSADLTVSNTDNVTWYMPGGTLTYTIRVANNGPQDVIGAVFADNLPTQISTWTWNCLADLSAICTAGPVTSSAIYTDTISIPAGKGVTYTVVATINPAATGNLVNTATVTAPAVIPDPVLGNNSASDTDAPPSADLSVTKTDGISIYTPGGTTTYTLVVTNNGPADVVGAFVSDSIPAQVISWIWTCVPDAGAVCVTGPVTLAGNFADTVNIPSGKKLTYTVVASINPGAVGTMTNSISVTAPATVPDPIPGNNTATDTDDQPTAELSVSITDMVVNYTAGGNVIYTIVVSNAGPSNAVGAVFNDNLPTQVTSWTWTCAADLGAACTPGPVTSSLNFMDTVNIPVGKKITYTVVVTISPVATGPMVNTASITSPVSVPDPNMTNNSATDIDTP